MSDNSNDQNIAVRVDGLSKLYRIGLQDEGHENLASALASFLKNPLSNYRKYRSLYDFSDVRMDMEEGADGERPDLLWAVRNLSFDVPTGQVVGIIGHNGAGKSTLLKILSRITAPTFGSVRIRGRVSSLLEVGTGFHQELTGRENVYLNGTILGMRKKEVDAVFDDIVEFSGVGRFLDTPVKRYSSGMKVRLAFAVAAHLEPEILIVDEVLSVGDAEFQRKCIGKMEAIGASGRTILFVSHNMAAVTRMCDRVLMMDHGQLVMDGTARDVVSHYLRHGRGKSSQRNWDGAQSPGGEIARLLSVSVCDSRGNPSDSMDIREPVRLRLEFECLEPGHVLMPAFSLWNDEGLLLFSAMDLDPEWRGRERPPGTYVCWAEIPGNLLSEGTMSINTSLWEWEPRRRLEYHEKDVVAFQVLDSLEGDSARGDFIGEIRGAIRPKLDWRTEWRAPAGSEPPAAKLENTGS